MPEPDGKLTREEMAEVTGYLVSLEEKMGKDLVCEVCGNNLWMVNSHLLSMRSDTPGPLEPHIRFPSVLIFCTNCGNQKQFVAQKVGVTPLGGEPPEQAATQEQAAPPEQGEPPDAD